MSDTHYNTVELDEDRETVNWESAGNHDTVYSNDEAAARHLLDRYDEETTREHFSAKGWSDEDIDALLADVADAEGEEEVDDPDLSKAEQRYERVDDALADAIRKTSWWEVEEYREGTALSKSPGVWRHDDEVPEYVRELIAEVLDTVHFDWETFDTLNPQQAMELEDILADRLTQPQGWSLGSVSEHLQEAFYLDEDTATGMAADTSHNVLSVAREKAYEEMEEPGETFVFDWFGPDDHRTTPVCKETKQEIEKRGGAVTMPTLKQILRQKAQKYEGTSAGGGTPQYVDNWQPHYRCRHMKARRVRSI